MNDQYRIRLVALANQLAMPFAAALIVLAGIVCLQTLVLATPASAQDMEFGEDEAEEDGMEFEEGDETEAAEEDEGSGDVIGDLVEEDTGDELDIEQEEKGDLQEKEEEIYAVPRRHVLRRGRVELAPAVGFTLNDPYVSHTSLSVALNYWWTNVLSIGLSFNWYGGLQNESDLNFFVRRSTRLAIPITDWQMAGYLNFSYVPLSGKFTMFREFIFQYNFYAVGGVGFMRTKPIPIIDPDVRTFDYDWRVAFNAGIGLQIFFTRWLSVFLEFRDYMFLDQHENLRVGVGPSNDPACNAAGKDARSCEASWMSDGATFTNALTAHIGLTIFLPTDFEYTTPK